MPNHYALSRASRDLDLEEIERRSDFQVYDAFVAFRFEENSGRPMCPHCGGEEVYPYKCRPVMKCKPCNRQFSPRVGTALYRTKISLYKIHKAAAMFVMRAKGINAIELSHALNVQYKTAYRLLQKFRNGLIPLVSMSQFANDVREGIAEALRNGTQIDGGEFGGHIRPKNVKKVKTDYRRMPYRSASKVQAVVAREPGGRIKIDVFDREKDAKPLLRMIMKRDTILFADKASWWGDLAAKFDLRQINHKRQYWSEEAHTNDAESFWSIARRSEHGTYHHISGIHLTAYLAEIAWRQEQNRASDRYKYEVLMRRLLSPIAPSSKFNRNGRRSARRAAEEAARQEYLAEQEARGDDDW